MTTISPRVVNTQVTRRIATQLAGCLLAAAACVALTAIDGEGWHDDTTGVTDLIGAFGFFIAVGFAVERAFTLRRRLAHGVRVRLRVRRRVRRVADDRLERRVDVNRAPPRVLAKLPGVDVTLAGRMAERRPFVSADDLGATLDLPADAVEALRPVTIFEERS